jgi:hypothetical protein
MPRSSKEVRRFFKLEISPFSLNAIAWFKDTAIMQIAIIVFNHLMADYLAHAGYIDDLDENSAPKRLRGLNMAARKDGQHAEITGLRWTPTSPRMQKYIKRLCHCNCGIVDESPSYGHLLHLAAQ